MDEWTPTVGGDATYHARRVRILAIRDDNAGIGYRGRQKWVSIQCLSEPAGRSNTPRRPRPANGRDLGDAAAIILRAAGTLDAMYAECARRGMDSKALRKRYAHLNPGMQRMNLGNSLRKILKDKANDGKNRDTGAKTTAAERAGPVTNTDNTARVTHKSRKRGNKRPGNGRAG